MTIDAQIVKDLRVRTGAGIMDCKEALLESDGNVEQAVDFLRKKGIAKAEKKAGRQADQGVVLSYIHPGNRIGVLVEVNCETDFVANTDDFRALAKDLALHIASSAPIAVSRDQIPDEVLERERSVYLEQVKEGDPKPDHIVDKIVEGKMSKFLKQNTLLAQEFVKDQDKTIEELITEVSARTGEKIGVGQFSRIKVGEEPT